MEKRQSVLQLVNQHNISPAYNHVRTSSYIFKLTQLISTIVCTGSYSKGVNGVTSSTTEQMLPYFVCSAYMIITPVILISYVLGHRMPEILIRIFNTLAGILFLVAGTVALQNWRKFKHDMKGKEEDADKQTAAVFLLTTGALCLVNSMLYLTDVAVSVHFTLSSP
ncbi:hypothetical protein L798_15310 [Zootermopsis nevadensis]|uniref:MARVEL domain-containing protein n=1 Tax=Zootermopsis nevadensis TaxID=136037 RepID=A0A067QNT1_ZOONE|nr:hypothetical protein L798_15310 [Zootermopsis nevadensis]